MTTTSGDIAAKEGKGRFPLIRKRWPHLIPKIHETVIAFMGTWKIGQKKRKKKKKKHGISKAK